MAAQKFTVLVPEVHYQTVEIEANSISDAVRAIRDGDGEYLDNALEYSCMYEDGVFIVNGNPYHED